MSDFRSAKWIELHEVNIALVGQADAESGWFWHWFDNPNTYKARFEIRGRDIAALFEIGGLDQKALSQMLNSTAEKSKNEKTYYESVDSYEFKIYDADPVEVKGYTELFARIDSAHLLSIKAVAVDEDETTWTDEFTYCGSFTVQWKSESNAG